MATMTQEELERRVQRLIDAANRESTAIGAEYDKKIYEARCEAAGRRALRSSMAENEVQYLRDACTEEVARIQRELDEKLEELYADAEQGTGGTVEAPYLVDYSLPMSERYIIVKEYYLAYEDKAQAVIDCENDSIAQEYLERFYSNLLQLLYVMAE